MEYSYGHWEIPPPSLKCEWMIRCEIWLYYVITCELSIGRRYKKNYSLFTFIDDGEEVFSKVLYIKDFNKDIHSKGLDGDYPYTDRNGKTIVVRVEMMTKPEAYLRERPADGMEKYYWMFRSIIKHGEIRV